ncbi:MAG: tRNA (guanosine(37)-N1)-methyltransferase TrmD [Eubacteriales bacterium]|nr:tRNA (guanosine(37)-N1)-methyltransferase TrmD [Eubacteriales bacterium]
MKITILTLFPKMFDALKESLIGKAINKGILQIDVVDFREFSLDKHKKVDDYAFSGGAGMVLTPQPIYDAIQSVITPESYVVYMSPKGTPLSQNKVIQMANDIKHLVIICGHYEGLDERIIQLCVDEQISVGDFVLTGGEIPAMALVDSVSRYVDGVLHNSDSVEDESFSDGLLEYPQYTRPQEFMGLRVPDVLLNGNHKEIAKWKQEQKILETKKYRPDLLEKLNKKD